MHIPFCDSKCYYCSFNSYVDKFEQIEKYMQALKTQLIYELKRFNVKKNSISSVFIGGGTPSTVKPKQYNKIFTLLKPYLKKNAEITTEANPNSAAYSWIKGMKELGATRISFGVQSFNDEKLKFLGRNHSSKQAIKAIKDACEIGFKNISLDLIYSTNIDTKKLLEDDIKQAFQLPINHISAYALNIEENTVFYDNPSVAKERLDLSNFFIDSIKREGFEQYEISNFGKYRCKHNIGYWQLKNYIGIGSGAVGMLENKRFYPSSNIESYIKEPTKVKIENLCKEDIKTEQLLLGMRSAIGVKINLLNKNELKRLNILIEEGKVILSNQKAYNPDFFISDELVLFIQS